jgi:hypothetical protein
MTSIWLICFSAIESAVDSFSLMYFSNNNVSTVILPQLIACDKYLLFVLLKEPLYGYIIPTGFSYWPA